MKTEDSSQKAPRLGSLAAAVAHPLNEELTLILNYVEVSLALIEAEHPARESLLSLQFAARRCADTSRALLQFSRRTEASRHSSLRAILELAS